MVESFGELPAITHALNIPDPGSRRKLLRLLRPLLSPLWDKFRSRKVALAGIMEDLPYYENRVLPPLVSNDTYSVRFQYHTHDNEMHRVTEFRSALMRAMLALSSGLLAESKTVPEIMPGRESSVTVTSKAVAPSGISTPVSVKSCPLTVMLPET